MNAIRLNHYIAQSGILSRRKADEAITAGNVSVNGKTVTELGTQIDPSEDKVTVNGRPIQIAERIWYLVYKPRGVITSASRQGRTPIITDLVPPVPPVYPVGRLDKDTSGLILLTNDGELANQIIHPRYHQEKEYRVTARLKAGTPPRTPEWIAERCAKGVRLGDGIAKGEVRKVVLDGEEISFSIIVTEGRHHLVRRMCAALGFHVKALKRTRIASLTLGNLKPGEYRTVSRSNIVSSLQ